MPPAKTKKPFTPKLERFLATVAYDGTDHIGWQVQTGRLSIQGELEARMSRILKTPIVIHGSGLGRCRGGWERGLLRCNGSRPATVRS